MSTSQTYYSLTRKKFVKYWLRYRKNLESGRFHTFSLQKKRGIVNKLKKLRRRLNQLELQLKLGFSVGALAFTILSSAPINAQELGPFVQNEIKNPLPRPLDTDFGVNPALVDLDNDGDLDLVWGKDIGTLVYHENIGTSDNAFFELREGSGVDPFDAIDVGKYSFPEFIDIDSDGDQDLVVGRNAGFVAFYENTDTSADKSNPTFEAPASPLPIESVGNGMSTNYTRPAFVDIDGDGDLDAFVGADYASGYEIVTFWENDGSNNFSQLTGASNPISGPLADPPGGIIYRAFPDFVDIDDDSDFDLVIGDENGNFRFFENTGTADNPIFASETTGSANPLAGFSSTYNVSPHFADIDADGDFDMIYGTGGLGNVTLLLNNGTSTAPVFENVELGDPLYAVNFGSEVLPTTTDVDSDGFEDIVAGRRDNQSLVYFRNNQDGTLERVNDASNPFFELIEINRKYVDPTFTDVDNDGDLDLFITHTSPNVPYTSTVEFYRNNAGTFNSETSPVPVTQDYTQLFVAGGDFDLDGDGDLILSSEDVLYNGSSLALYLSDGNGILILQNQSDPPFNNIDLSVGYSSNFAPEMVDLDHDGDTDLVTGVDDGPRAGYLGFIENLGGSLNFDIGSTSIFGTFDVGSESNPAVLDMDNDGDLDVLVGNSSGRFSFIENQNIPAGIAATTNDPITYNEGDIPVQLNNTLVIFDQTNDPIIEARVVIENYIDGEDFLDFDPGFGTSGTFETTGPNAGTLIISVPQVTTFSELQTVLRGVTYENIGSSATGGTRAIRFEVVDFDNTNPTTEDVVIVELEVIADNLPPSITSSNQDSGIDYVQDNPAVVIDDLIEVSDQDDTELVSATVALTGFLEGDVLTFTDQNGIIGNFEEGSLSLSGTATLEQYQTALRSVGFSSSNGASTRTARFAVSDGTDVSPEYSRVITISDATESPVVDTTPSSTQVGGLVIINWCDIIDDPDNDDSELTIEVVSILSGASAEVVGCNIEIDYAGLSFFGEDQLVLRATDPDGNLDENTLFITVEDVIPNPSGEVRVFNAVSPNGDNSNDTWRIENLVDTPNKIELFNRWGDLVETINDYVDPGDNLGEVYIVLDDLPSGTYFYKISSPQGEFDGFLVIKK